MLSPAVEDYLKAIYKLQGEGTVSTSEIARALDLSPASVTNMAKRLSDMGLAKYQSYKGVMLTEAGNKVALEIIRHHRLLELYLKEVMGYSWDKLHAEAEQLEHHISEEFEARIDEMLNYPTHDPHGHPIPTPEGEVADMTVETLSQTPPGHTVTVRYVSDSDPELLQYLEELGLLPGTAIEVLKRAPFNGPLTIRAGSSKEEVVGVEVASNVFIEPAAG